MIYLLEKNVFEVLKMLDLSQLTEWQISLVVVLFGALILYFGKLIADTKVERYDKLSYYIEGLFFFIVYVTMPVIFVFFIKGFIIFPVWLCFLIQLIILGCLSWNLKANEYLWKHSLIDEVEKRFKKNIEELKISNTTKGKLINKYEPLLKKRFEMDYVKFCLIICYKIPRQYFGNQYILFTFSFLSVLSSLSLFENENILFLLISILILFFILSLIALAHGFRTAIYPQAKIYYENGETTEGKVLKFGDYVYLLKGNKKIFVNKDKIKYIEENLFKEDGTDV